MPTFLFKEKYGFFSKKSMSGDGAAFDGFVYFRKLFSAFDIVLVHLKSVAAADTVAAGTAGAAVAAERPTDNLFALGTGCIFNQIFVFFVHKKTFLSV